MAGPLLSLKYLQCMFSFFGYAGSSLLQGLFSSYGEPSYSMGFSDSSVGKESPAGQETWVGKILWRRKWQPTAWKISWTEEAGRLQSMGLFAVHGLLLIVVSSFSARALEHKLNSCARVLLFHCLWDLP